MKLLIDEMYTATIADQLRTRGHDVASVHDPAYRTLEGAPDDEVWRSPSPTIERWSRKTCRTSVASRPTRWRAENPSSA